MGGKMIEMSIEDELKDSYLTYAMSVIVSRALPDVRDGLKPSQRRILVAMNDLNLAPGAGRVKCAKISGDTSGNYHPHGESVIYPTLVRMAQEWNMRHVLIDKQGNFGSIAGLPPAAMRYTEARLSPIAALMLDDLKLDTVDFIPTYDERRTEPTVLPSKFPNLLVNGANGIAVGMATSIPPHNLSEVCDAADPRDRRAGRLDRRAAGDHSRPRFSHRRASSAAAAAFAAAITPAAARSRCARGPRSRSTRRTATGSSSREIPYQQARDRVEERIGELINDERIKGISAQSQRERPARSRCGWSCELKRDADPEVVLNQLYQFSPLQDSFSIILLALVDGKPRMLHAQGDAGGVHAASGDGHPPPHAVPAGQGPPAEAHGRRACCWRMANIDEIIRIIRSSQHAGRGQEPA